MAATVRVGVIGTGVGVLHIEALRQVPGAVVTAVCSARATRAEEVATRFGIPLATDDYRDVLAADVDAVIVATPPALHLPMGLDALAARKHLFCEKPVALSLAEARTLRDAARAAGVVHMLNHYVRFAPPFAHLKTLVDDGYLGQLAVADALILTNPIDYLNSSAWSDTKAGWYTDGARMGGLLAGAGGPHLIDLLLWCCGPIVEVAARTTVTHRELALASGQVVRGVSGEDTFVLIARFADDRLITMRGVSVAYHGGLGFSLSLHGTHGSLFADYSGLRGATATDQAPAALPLPADAPQDRVAIATQFIEAIRSGGPSPSPSLDDGVAVQAVIDASLAAARTDGWVRVAAD
jgi:predicted dehydrogenase